MTPTDLEFPAHDAQAEYHGTEPTVPVVATTATPKKPAAKRAYTVLKAGPAVGEWHTVGAFEASTEQQALALAIEAEGTFGGGTYTAIARFVPRTVDIQPVQTTKLVWS